MFRCVSQTDGTRGSARESVSYVDVYVTSRTCISRIPFDHGTIASRYSRNEEVPVAIVPMLFCTYDECGGGADIPFLIEAVVLAASILMVGEQPLGVRGLQVDAHANDAFAKLRSRCVWGGESMYAGTSRGTR